MAVDMDGVGSSAAGAGAGAGTSGRLTTQQVAELLGVKTATVYAYASRGLLSSERVPGGKGSTFDAREVDALAAGQRRRLPKPPSAESGLPPIEPVTVRTALTLIEDGRLYYRGADAVRLAERCGFEAAVGWLWGVGSDSATATSAPAGRAVASSGPAEAAVVLRAPAELVATLRRAGQALPTAARLPDRLRVSAAVAATVDPLRFDLREENVRAMGAGLIAALVEALPAAAGAVAGAGVGAQAAPGDAEFPVGASTVDASLAARLWTRLASTAPAPGAVECLDRALVLLADHELAVSTVAARVAASARAHPYAVVSAGLGASDGPLHGAASALAHRMLGEVLAAGDAVPVVSEYLRTGVLIPGLGHRLYPQGDPRARALLGAMRQLPGAETVLAAVEAVVRAAGGPRARAGDAANVDLALAAFAQLNGMAPEAGEVVFSVARTAGWLAHAMEEYREAPLRMRARGIYVGPPAGREF
ncbi:citrate synthase [Kitasatospora kifunensis]|uniref:citrate synthase (unknown stereospecificity) n=1 Tax=Kitasatospora kifunensis TaxID=58351 RepID=A0A7W7R467_KITKI|nr:citrate synthase [Kitasatospora kifunensis]MBB4925147.1 citrate synthase [Kitasatospora kifunensis]